MNVIIIAAILMMLITVVDIMNHQDDRLDGKEPEYTLTTTEAFVEWMYELETK